MPPPSSAFERRSVREEFGAAFPEVLIGRPNDQGKTDGNRLHGVLPSVVRRQGFSRKAMSPAPMSFGSSPVVSAK